MTQACLFYSDMGFSTEDYNKLVEKLRKLLSHTSASIRAHAARALGELTADDKDTILEVLPLLADKDVWLYTYLFFTELFVDGSHISFLFSIKLKVFHTLFYRSM